MSPPDDRPDGVSGSPARRGWRFALGILVSLELVVAIAATLVLGTPERLPGAAMGSEVLFHGYRALAAFVALYLLTVVLVRSFGGSLAMKVSTTGLEWSGGDAGQTAADQLTKLNLRLDDQASFVRSVVERLMGDRTTLQTLERRVERVDNELQQIRIRVVDLERKPS